MALSRARDRLLLYAARETADGKRRDVSPFVDRLGDLIGQIESAATGTGEAGERLVPVGGGGPLSYEASEISIYGRCPRRFLYSRVLQSGGRRSMTPFMLMHEAVRSVKAALCAGDIVLDPAASASILAAADAACVEQGLEDHGYRSEFAGIAAGMLTRFLRSREGWSSERTGRMSLSIGRDEIRVHADELRTRPGSAPVLARVQTGKRKKADEDDLVATALLLAAGQHSPLVEAKIFYLTDGGEIPLSLTPRQIDGRRQKIADHLDGIRVGRFPARSSSFSCPSCPAFFICGPLPEGPL
ncbi:PD-(D/E)XK nuclease family protein [Komagataeibacter rhaeticus]|nr:PD-(D/E)XK nuclease family protein [Komagataeibacter rhaeticus]